MCLAAKCPLPKGNVETTKLFLRRITDDNGETPRNVKAILQLLNKYNGPYDTDEVSAKEIREEQLGEHREPMKKESEEGRQCVPYKGSLNSSRSLEQIQMGDCQIEESTHLTAKRTAKTTNGSKRSEKDGKKQISKIISSRIPMTKSTPSKT
ncbi:hypothetical protein RUM44_002055 [Polyplax serrata]|uniref:Uncharacterized protein n=1 Tax=Polyplax serrata TaxID=468196 RepID=A0ABR1ANJ7_POLSC